jgi:hypothetical protein
MRNNLNASPAWPESRFQAKSSYFKSLDTIYAHPVLHLIIRRFDVIFAHELQLAVVANSEDRERRRQSFLLPAPPERHTF